MNHSAKVNKETHPDRLIMEEILGDITAMKLCHDAIKEAVGFDLPFPTKQKFRRLANSMHSSRDLPNLKRLTIGEGSPNDCLATFFNARGYVEEGLAAAYYHYGNVEALERKTINVALHKAPPIPGKYGGTYAFGASEKFSFEYIAFAFALRRTMEYLAVSVAAFFNTKSGKKGFRGLKTTINGLPPEEIGERIKKKHDEHMKKLSDIIAELRGWDPRSIFAHRRAADSWLNICW